MSQSIYIRYQDPNIARGGQVATTGETIEEYTNRMINKVAMEAKERDTSKIVYDSYFLTTLPYTFMVDETVNENERSIFLSPFRIFTANLQASLGDDILNNAAIRAVVEAGKGAYEDDGFDVKLHATELFTTELGGNEVINPYWSFNENDDIIYPVNAIDPPACTIGLGRVYAEMYQKTQVVLWITFGVPQYAGIWDFYHNAIHSDLASEMHAGTSSVPGLLGRIIGGALMFTFTLATLPLYVLQQIGKLFNSYTITKYYELKATMPLYYRAVNNLMGVVAVNMGLEQGGEAGQKSDGVKYNIDDLPNMLRYGLSIYEIMDRRSKYFAIGKGREGMSADDLYLAHSRAEAKVDEFKPSSHAAGTGNHLLQKFSDAFMANSTGSTGYIGFRVEKSVDASESVSNSTGPSELKDKLNSFQKKKAEIAFNTMKGETGQGLISGLIGDLVQGIADFGKGLLNAVDITGMSGILTNIGYFDIPDVYKDSSFSTSYNFSIDLVSHYCDRVSIFQNLYVPLFCILAGALPRQVGRNTYVEPFICRAYCKGRFAVSVGMIDSVSITRGSDEFGWTSEGFPTRIKITFSIKDLSPLMFLGLSGANGGTNALTDLMNIFNSNSTMQEYLSTLGGLGLRERILFFPSLNRKFKAWWHVNFNTRLLNSYFWGTGVGNIPAIQTLMAWKFSRLSNG